MDFWSNKKILITGGDGFFGTAIVNKLLEYGVQKKGIVIPNYPEDDLLNYSTCYRLTKNINIVIHLAAKVGGILYNQKHPGSMIFENLQMGLNMMEASRLNKVEKIVNIGTTCGYPSNAPVPFKEADLWNGYPAVETAPYGLAKKMLLELGKGYNKEYGIKSNYILPVNLYGPNDHFEGENTHVIPALINRFVDAKRKNLNKTVVWGSGKATREFIYIEDAAEGVLRIAEKYDYPDALNLGTGVETSIKQLVETISKLVGFNGQIVWDTSKPDGTLRRCLDISKLQKETGFVAQTSLNVGLERTISWYIKALDCEN